MPHNTPSGTKWLVVLSALLFFPAAIASQSVQSDAKGKRTLTQTRNSIGTSIGSANPASSTESKSVSYAETFTFAGEPKATAYPNPVIRLANKAFVVAYDEQRENPAWAAYKVPGQRKFGVLPRPSRFATDSRTRARVTHNNYSLTGYDRGHMVPNLAIASRFGVEAQAETFLMSNIVPQKPALNQGPWRLLEETLAETTATHCAEIWVVVGPIYEGPVKKLRNGTVIPTAFFMVIADETTEGPRLQAFIMPQTTTRGADYRNYRTTVQDVQIRTGLDLFWELPDELENRLEADKGPYWLE
jgi:endonuclease G